MHEAAVLGGFAPLAAIYSVNLHASKDLIASKKPQVRAIAFSKDKNPGEDQVKSAVKSPTPADDDGNAADPLSPVDVMIRLGRMQPGGLNIMKFEDWPPYHSYKEEHPELQYTH